MARVKLDFPDEVYTYRTELAVRFDDVNIGHHLGNDRLVSMLGEARSRFLASLGLTDTQTDQTPGTIVADLVVTYRAEARHRDLLRFDVGVAEHNRYGGDVAYRVVRADALGDETVIAVAKTGLLFYDYATAQIVSAPAAFANA